MKFKKPMQLDFMKLEIITTFQVYLDVKDDVGIFWATVCVCVCVCVCEFLLKEWVDFQMSVLSQPVT